MDIGAAVLRDVCTDEILDLVKPVALLQLISNVHSSQSCPCLICVLT